MDIISVDIQKRSYLIIHLSNAIHIYWLNKNNIFNIYKKEIQCLTKIETINTKVKGIKFFLLKKLISIFKAFLYVKSCTKIHIFEINLKENDLIEIIDSGFNNFFIPFYTDDKIFLLDFAEEIIDVYYVQFLNEKADFTNM